MTRRSAPPAASALDTWRIVQPSRRAYVKSTGSTGRIERRGIASAATRRPSPTADRIASLAWASPPSTSAVGSASAYPRFLRLPQRVRKRNLPCFHARQHIVAGAVQHPEHPLQPIAGQTFPHRPDDGYASGDRRLEQQVAPVFGRDLQEIASLPGHDLLVRRDDRLAGLERLSNPLRGRFQAADELDHDIRIGAQDGAEIGCPGDGVRHPVDDLPFDAPVADVRQAH